MMEPVVSVDWLKAQLNDPHLIILDASMKGNVSGLAPEFPGVRIKGARYFDLKGSFSDKSSHLPNTLPSQETFTEGCQKLGINQNSKLVIYDNLGIYSSPRVKWMFTVMGHSEVAVLDGGLPAWINAKEETEEIKEETSQSGNFIATLNKEALKSADNVFENITQKEFLTIDARSAGRFNGSSPEPRADLKSGHVPGSISLPFKDVLENGKFKPKKELERTFSQMNPDNSPMTFTCGSGLTACIILLAAELVSESPKYIYDGSWTEWASLPDMPIATES